MGATKVGMKQLFGDAGQAQQIHSLRNQVDELQSEITLLRNKELSSESKAALEQQIEELTAQLAKAGGEHEILIEFIDPDPEQPRKTITPLIVQERAESLRRHGQKTAAILIPQPNGRYKLFDGEIRWRGAKLIGWKTLRSVLLSQKGSSDEVEIFEGQVVTGIHSQKLHDLDLASSLIRLAVMKYPHLKERSSEIPKILNTAFRRLQREGKHLELAQIKNASLEQQQNWIELAPFKEVEEQEIFAVLLRLQLNPVTINNTVFPLLTLPEDLKQAINSEGLESSKARELNKLSVQQLNLDEDKTLEIRREVLRKVVEQKLSLNEVKGLVNQVIAKHTQKSHTRTSVSRLAKAIQEAEIEQIQDPKELKALEEVFQKKLAEIQSALAKHNGRII